MFEAPPTSDAHPPRDPRVSIQWLLVLDAGIRLFIWSTSLAITMFVAVRYGGWSAFPWSRLGEFIVAWSIAQRVVHMTVLFNVSYLVLLAGLRMLVPRPRVGHYSMARRLDRNVIFMSFLWVLAKARYQPPFPAFLVPQLANIAPLRWLMNWQFGPHSRSVFFVEPNILDPSFVTIGKNVTVGFGTTIVGHLQDPKGMMLDPTVIEDDVLIGGHTAIGGVVRIKRGAVVRAFSMLLPGTVVGEKEFWGGIPARRLREAASSGM